MSLFAHLRRRTTGTHISRDIWFGWITGGNKCSAPRTEMGGVRRLSTLVNHQEDDAKSSTTTSPDPLPVTHATREARPSLPEISRTRLPEERETQLASSSSRVEQGPRVEHSATTNTSPDSSDERAKKKPRLTVPPDIIVTTLDPKAMESEAQQIHDLSLLHTASVMFKGVDPSNNKILLIPDFPYIRGYSNEKSRDTRPRNTWPVFPRGSKGVLYYHRPPERPEINGSLRFRLCDTLADFDKGTDLLAPDKSVWGSSLYNIYRNKPSNPVGAALERDGLVDGELATEIQRLPHLPAMESHTLYSLHDTFDVDLQGPFKLYLMTLQMIRPINIVKAFADDRPKSRQAYILPYTGRIRARFEISTLERHSQVPTLVLRVLEVLSDVQCVVPAYGRYLAPPMKGELIEKRIPGSRFHAPWSLPVMPGIGNAKALFDAFAAELHSNRR